jgi:hypothetical protein
VADPGFSGADPRDSYNYRATLEDFDQFNGTAGKLKAA